MMTKNDIVNSRREACERAEAKGKAEGRAEGAAEKQREVAGKMKGKGLDAETIADCTGLTVEEVEAL